jgi:2'-5' RNA ligase/GNAT superfamily N-acetyltransferase
VARHRLLVALIPPVPLALEAEGLRIGLGDRSRSRIPPHITVLPPANVPDGSLGDVLAAMRSAAEGCAPIDLVLGSAGTFLPRTPVVYLAVGGPSGSGPPAGLVRLRDELLESPAGRAEDRPFVPHLTIAGRLDRTAIPGIVGSLSAFERPWRCDRVHLLHQVPTEAGPTRWERLADAPLGQRPKRIGTGGRVLELGLSEQVGPDLAAATSLRVPGGPSEPWWIPARRNLVATARRDGQVVGGALVDVGPAEAVHPAPWDRARLLGVEVVAAGRQEGTGRHLVRHLEAVLAEMGWSRVEAEAPDGPVGALLAGLGWQLDRSAGDPVLVRKLPKPR